MERRFQIRRPADNATVLRARMVFACVDLDSGRPRRLPREFVASYGAAVIAGHDAAPVDL
jgi:acyl-CoA thioester hydrolase